MGYGSDAAIIAARDALHHMTAKGFGHGRFKIMKLCDL